MIPTFTFVIQGGKKTSNRRISYKSGDVDAGAYKISSVAAGHADTGAASGVVARMRRKYTSCTGRRASKGESAKSAELVLLLYEWQGSLLQQYFQRYRRPEREKKYDIGAAAAKGRKGVARKKRACYVAGVILSQRKRSMSN